MWHVVECMVCYLRSIFLMFFILVRCSSRDGALMKPFLSPRIRMGVGVGKEENFHYKASDFMYILHLHLLHLQNHF